MKFQEISDHLVDAHLYMGNHNDALEFAEHVGLKDKLRFNSDQLFLITKQDENGLTLDCIKLTPKTWIVKVDDRLDAMDMTAFGEKYIPVPERVA